MVVRLALLLLSVNGVDADGTRTNCIALAVECNACVTRTTR